MMAAYPFQPMTTELLKKLTRVNQDSNQPINCPELPAVLATQELKSGLDLNSPRSETNQSDIRT
jgi:hypothetical protein